ncbi:MAG TPA: hypothetical protein VJB98_01300 [Candidatus Paceibacterota bacterium]
MKFPYARFGVVGKEILKRPVVPVTLKNDGKKVKYYALIDSGADLPIFDASLCDLLGINLMSGDPIVFGGAESSRGSLAYVHNITLEIGSKIIKTKIAFATNLADFGHGLLGQSGFFDKFVVKFNYSKGEIEIK